jgi:hypothetical protein
MRLVKSLLICVLFSTFAFASEEVPRIREVISDIFHDQKAIMTSPARFDSRDAAIWGLTGASILYLAPRWNGRPSVDSHVDRGIDRDDPPQEQFLRQFTKLGEGEVGYGLSVFGYAIGRWTDHDRLAAGSAHLFEALTDASLWVTVGKVAFGRRRPLGDGAGGDYYGPYGYFGSKRLRGYASFPSGHTTIIFTMATVISREADTPWVSVPVYLTAAGVGFSRIYLDEHWLSDCTIGAALGYSIATLVENRHAHSHSMAFHVEPTFSPEVVKLTLVYQW